MPFDPTKPQPLTPLLLTPLLSGLCPVSVKSNFLSDRAFDFFDRAHDARTLQHDGPCAQAGIVPGIEPGREATPAGMGKTHAFLILRHVRIDPFGPGVDAAGTFFSLG